MKQIEHQNFKIPPHSLEIEESILASCLLYPEHMAIFADILKPDDFYRSAHSRIYQACLNLYRDENICDLVTVTGELKKNDEIERIGGAIYLAKLIDRAPIAVVPEQYAETIKGKAILRKAIEVSSNIAKECFEDHREPQQIINDAIQRITEIETTIYGKDTFVNMKSLSLKMVEYYEKLQEADGNITGVPSGFADLDYFTAGFQKGDFILIAGRPSMGKTALALNILRKLGPANIPCGLFSLEQPREQIYNRALSAETNINLHSFRSGEFSKQEWVKITEEVGSMYAWPVYIDDTPTLHYSEIRRRARKLKRKCGAEIIFIDYLQLLEGDKQAGRVEEVSSISRNLKAIARELNIPIVGLSQLNRKVEERRDKRPILSDLRDSGSLEQDADIVMFLYRDEVYNKSKDNPKRGLAEIDIAKHRNGPTGTIELCWIKTTTKFEDLVKDF